MKEFYYSECCYSFFDMFYTSVCTRIYVLNTVSRAFSVTAIHKAVKSNVYYLLRFYGVKEKETIAQDLCKIARR